MPVDDKAISNGRMDPAKHLRAWKHDEMRVRLWLQSARNSMATCLRVDRKETHLLTLGRRGHAPQIEVATPRPSTAPAATIHQGVFNATGAYKAPLQKATQHSTFNIQHSTFNINLSLSIH